MDEIIGFVRELVVRNTPNSLILEYLKREKQTVISFSTLKRYMKEHNIRRYDRAFGPQEVENAIRRERETVGRNAGIRFLAISLRLRHGLLVTRRQIQDACTVIVGTGQGGRRMPIHRRLAYCPGPNYRWCEDGHDKLGQTWGIYIHGCIDEYSRRLLWLRAYSTNRKPEIIAKYYLDAVSKLGVAPEYVVSDFGGESVIVARCQQFFYRDDATVINRHRWNYSVTNVTIEAFWRQFRARCGDYWADQFQRLSDDGFWDGTELDTWCLLAVYLPLISVDLSRVMVEHNAHYIRKQRNRIRPHGVPDDLYRLPHMFDGRLCGRRIEDADIESALANSGVNTLDLPDFLLPEVRAIVDTWMLSNRVLTTIDNARSVYCQLRAYFLANFEML